MAGSPNLLEFSDARFKADVLESGIPVLVDFWAPWCGPCRAIAPLIEQLADEYAGRVKIGKMNVDSNVSVAGNFGISAIPTLLFVKNGKVVDQLVGAADKAKIVARLDKLLG